MGVTVHVSEEGYITYTIQSGYILWTVDEQGNILNEAVTEKEIELERSLI